MHGNWAPGRVVAKISVAVVLCIYFSFWYVYHFVCKPDLRWAIVFNVAFFMGVWSYLRTCLTDPGTPACKEWKRWESTRSEQDAQRTKESYENDDEQIRRRRQNSYSPGEATWCSKCSRERPERAHHCSMCGVCVLRMDHHCPWIGTCVGFRNHKYFILMNMWTFLASFVYLTTSRKPSVYDLLDLTSDYQPSMGLAPVVLAVMSIVFSMVTGGMFLYAIWLANRNLTTIEELFRGKNPYRLTNFADNLSQLIGPLEPRMLLPLEVDRAGSECDGTTFPLGDGDSRDPLDTSPSSRLAYGAV